MVELRARIALDISILLSNALDMGNVEAPIAQTIRQAFDTGTGANQGNMAFGDERTVNATTTDSLDLAGGLASPLGGNITFTALKGIAIVADPTNGGNLLVGEGVSSAFAGPFGASAVGITLEPGGILLLTTPSAAGWTVTASTGDILAVENLDDAAAKYKIILIGETA